MCATDEEERDSLGEAGTSSDEDAGLPEHVRAPSPVWAQPLLDSPSFSLASMAIVPVSAQDSASVKRTPVSFKLIVAKNLTKPGASSRPQSVASSRAGSAGHPGTKRRLPAVPGGATASVKPEAEAADAPPSTADDIAEQVLALTRVRLDNCSITHIDNLECLGRVTHLSLDDNSITELENLDCLPHLRTLSVARNRIRVLGGLSTLHSLLLLDVSHNMIAAIDASAIPRSVTLLSLFGNPIASMADYRQHVEGMLPQLKQLDGRPVGDDESDDSDGAQASTEHAGSARQSTPVSSATFLTSLELEDIEAVRRTVLSDTGQSISTGGMQTGAVSSSRPQSAAAPATTHCMSRTCAPKSLLRVVMTMLIVADDQARVAELRIMREHIASRCHSRRAQVRLSLFD